MDILVYCPDCPTGHIRCSECGSDAFDLDWIGDGFLDYDIRCIMCARSHQGAATHDVRVYTRKPDQEWSLYVAPRKLSDMRWKHIEETQRSIDETVLNQVWELDRPDPSTIARAIGIGPMDVKNSLERLYHDGKVKRHPKNGAKSANAWSCTFTPAVSEVTA